MENNNTIGVHYQTWKNKLNVEKALKTFREHYQTEPIRMVSDGGDDFSDLAKKYNCIFDYESENIYPKAIFKGHNVWQDNPTYDGALVWLKRLYDTCKKIESKWVIMMEDDVFTIGQIQKFPTTHSAGSIQTIQFAPILTNYLRSLNSENNLWSYNMSGGSIVDREFYIYAYENFIDKFDIKHICSMDNRVGGWSDILLNVFIIFSNGTTGRWDQTTHPNQNSGAFIHGDKSSYTEIQGSLYV